MGAAPANPSPQEFPTRTQSKSRFGGKWLENEAWPRVEGVISVPEIPRLTLQVLGAGQYGDIPGCSSAPRQGCVLGKMKSHVRPCSCGSGRRAGTAVLEGDRLFC